MQSKKYHIKTFGCQMNVYDSSRMGDILETLGYRATDNIENTDIVILNTCHIREKATEKIFSDLGRIKKIKDRRASEGDRMIVGVAGCVAQAEGTSIMRRAPIVDIVMGPQNYHRLPELLEKIKSGGRASDIEFPTEDKFDYLPQQTNATNAVENASAFVAIQEGCDKFCTYCVVPYTRGAEFSRPVKSVLAEINKLVDLGAKEITLLGQNVNAYHGEFDDETTWSLGKLLREIAQIDKIERIRYTTSYPAEIDDELISAHREVKKIMPYLHLPVQAGSDKILKAMNRRHDRQFYLDLVKKLRDNCPDLALSSDFIVGFPGETDDDFEETLDLVRQVGFMQAYSFMYSPRAGTPAAEMEEQVPQDVKEKRLAQLQQLLTEQNLAFNQKWIDKELDIIVTGVAKNPNQVIGRSPWMQPVNVEGGEDLIGKTIKVRITKALRYSLLGEIITDQ